MEEIFLEIHRIRQKPRPITMRKIYGTDRPQSLRFCR